MGGAALDECGAGILILERETSQRLMRGEDSYLGASKKARRLGQIGPVEMLRDKMRLRPCSNGSERNGRALAFPARDLRRASAPLLTFYHRCGNPPRVGGR